VGSFEADDAELGLDVLLGSVVVPQLVPEDEDVPDAPDVAVEAELSSCPVDAPVPQALNNNAVNVEIYKNF
jgi:hypothetical protein